MCARSGMDYARLWCTEKGVWHDAIIDHEDTLGLLDGSRPVVIELLPGGRTIRPFDPRESWTREPVVDCRKARRRLWLVLRSSKRQHYNMLFNNCEHFARFVAFGEFRSPQVRGALTIAVLFGLLFTVGRQPPKAAEVRASTAARGRASALGKTRTYSL
jgi:hypothetical protein